MDDTASTASENQNELSTEMTDEQMTQFVDDQLGPQPTVNTRAGYTNPDDPATGTPPAVDKKEGAEDEESEDEKAKTAEVEKQAAADKAIKDAETARQAEADKKAAEESKPQDIPAVDTSDLWIEVEAYEVEGEGEEQKAVEKTVRISLDAGQIPENVRFKNDKQLMEVLDSLGEMRQIRAERVTEHDQKVAEQEELKSEQTTQAQTLAGWDSEIDELTEAGILEKPKAQPKGPNGYTEEEIKADPALSAIDNVFKYMTTENEKRKAEGKAPIASFGTAYNLFTKQSTSKEDAEKAAKEAELTKKRGSMVGGGSGTGGGGTKNEKLYQAGSAKSIFAVDTSDL